MFAPGAYLHGNQIRRVKKAQHLVHFVHAQGLLALLQLTDKAQTDVRLVGQVYLSEVKLLRISLTKSAISLLSILYPFGYKYTKEI